MRPRTPAFDRAMNKVLKDLKSGCWIWQGRVSSTGCPMLWIHERDADLSVARVLFEIAKGEIPRGHRLFHTCHNRRCVNPEHMVPVTPFESMTRSHRSPSVQNSTKTHCPKGHPYSGDNLKLDRAGRNRLCRTCRNERSRIAMRAKYVAARANRLQQEAGSGNEE